MKKIFALFFVMILIASQLVIPASAETYVPTRVINLVYDDSGSMILDWDTKEYCDSWCQAKYALEVFTAMLGEKDTLNVYYMSNYESGTTTEPGLIIKGSRDAAVTERNVKKVHDTITPNGGTPFGIVGHAKNGLRAETADEKWLVVLTDGEFPGTTPENISAQFEAWESEFGINIVMLAMGPDAPGIAVKQGTNIFFEKAETSKDIPGKLTGICNRIFQNNALPLNGQDASFNVPMSQLIIFAQGENVSINGIETPDGSPVTPDSNVKVEYSTQATKNGDYDNDTNVIVATDLKGYVATFNGDFVPGDYKFDVTGAEDLQVYYKPNVSIAAYLYDGESEVTKDDTLAAGTYKLEFGFVSATTGEKITDTSLLGNITYKAEVKTVGVDGTEEVVEVNSGDTITLKEGSLEIDVVASFLEYNTVNTKLSYNVLGRRDLIFTFESKPTYDLTSDGFTNPDEPMVLRVKIDDGQSVHELSAQQWELLGIPEITTGAKLGAFKVERTDELGKFLVYPTLKDNDPMETDDGTIKISVLGQFVEGEVVAYGKLEDTFEISSNISFMDRVKDFLEKYWKQLVISILLLILILGYIPPFKRYLPRKIKKRPLITCSAQKVGLRDMESHGKFKRNLASTLIPYKAETGFVTFAPAPHKKTASLKATSGHGMYVTNAKAFAGKPEFTFNGMPIEEGRTKAYRINGGSTISRSTPEYMYTCYLNR